MTKEILDKISSYNIFNYLLPGILLAVCVEASTKYSVIIENSLLGLFVYYFYGLMVSRIGSLIVEPLLKKTKFISFADYGDFITATSKDAKIELLSEVNNMYRTLISLVIVTVLVFLYSFAETKFPWLVSARLPVAFLLLFIVLVFSYTNRRKIIWTQ